MATARPFGNGDQSLNMLCVEQQKDGDWQRSTGLPAADRSSSHQPLSEVRSFRELVLSNLLPLPPSQTCLTTLEADASEGTRILYYALRCHELHNAFRKATEETASADSAGQLSTEESDFLRSLLAIMRNNKDVQVPSRRQLRATCTTTALEEVFVKSAPQSGEFKSELPASDLGLLGRTAPVENFERPRVALAPSATEAKSFTAAVPSRGCMAHGPRTSKSEVQVVLPITRRRRAALEACDAMTSADFVDPKPRQSATTPPSKKSIQRRRGVRYSRPRQPELVPARFSIRGHLPANLDPNVLEEHSLLRRCCLHECRWTEEGKVCDADLASEWHLSRHFLAARHTLGARLFITNLFQCRWLDCGGPTFWDEEDLMQHIQAMHVGRTLACPFEDCDFRLHNVSHLTRHIAKQHDDAGNQLRPMGDLSERLVPKKPPPLPRYVRTEELIIPAVRARAAVNRLRADIVRKKVLQDSLASDERQLHAERAPHILERLESDAAVECLAFEASQELVIVPIHYEEDSELTEQPSKKRML